MFDIILAVVEKYVPILSGGSAFLDSEAEYAALRGEMLTREGATTNQPFFPEYAWRSQSKSHPPADPYDDYIIGLATMINSAFGMDIPNKTYPVVNEGQLIFPYLLLEDNFGAEITALSAVYPPSAPGSLRRLNATPFANENRGVRKHIAQICKRGEKGWRKGMEREGVDIDSLPMKDVLEGKRRATLDLLSLRYQSLKAIVEQYPLFRQFREKYLQFLPELSFEEQLDFLKQLFIVADRDKLGIPAHWYTLVPSTVFMEPPSDVPILPMRELLKRNNQDDVQVFHRTRSMIALLSRALTITRNHCDQAVWGKRELTKPRLDDENDILIDPRNIDRVTERVKNLLQVYDTARSGEISREDRLLLYTRAKELLRKFGFDAFWLLDIASAVFSPGRSAEIAHRLQSTILDSALGSLKKQFDAGINTFPVYQVAVRYKDTDPVVLVINGIRDPRKLNGQLNGIRKEYIEEVSVDSENMEHFTSFISEWGIPVSDAFHTIDQSDCLSDYGEKRVENLPVELKAPLSHTEARYEHAKLVDEGNLTPVTGVILFDDLNVVASTIIPHWWGMYPQYERSTWIPSDL